MWPISLQLFVLLVLFLQNDALFKTHTTRSNFLCSSILFIILTSTHRIFHIRVFWFHSEILAPKPADKIINWMRSWQKVLNNIIVFIISLSLSLNQCSRVSRFQSSHTFLIFWAYRGKLSHHFIFRQRNILNWYSHIDMLQTLKYLLNILNIWYLLNSDW